MILKSAGVFAHVRLSCKAVAYLRQRQARKARQKNAPEDIKSASRRCFAGNPDTGAQVYGTRGLCSITADPLHQKVLCHHDAGDRTKSKSMSRSVPVLTDILKSPAVRLDR
jgi:hypothetical protein